MLAECYRFYRRGGRHDNLYFDSNVKSGRNTAGLILVG